MGIMSRTRAASSSGPSTSVLSSIGLVAQAVVASTRVNVGVDASQAPHAIFVLEGTGIHHSGGSRTATSGRQGQLHGHQQEGEGIVFTPVC
jgi:hypothetical protein